eukprot:6179235-Pleurochrysis_carterae.AAC.2
MEVAAKGRTGLAPPENPRTSQLTGARTLSPSFPLSRALSCLCTFLFYLRSLLSSLSLPLSPPTLSLRACGCVQRKHSTRFVLLAHFNPPLLYLAISIPFFTPLNATFRLIL